jgi:hypothetical protein
MNRFVLLLIGLQVGLAARAQILPDFIGSEANGKAGIAVLENSLWSVFNNPANLARIANHQVGINHQQLFLNSGLSQSSVAAAYKHKFATYGMGLNVWGYPYFKTNQINAAAGKKLNDKWTIGINLAYTTFNFGDNYYGKQRYLKSGIGTTIQLPKHIKIGIYIQNIHRPKVLETPKERDETFIKAGITYKPNEQVEVAAEAVQQLNRRLVLRVGMEYLYKEKNCFSIGISDNSTYGQFSFGFGQKLKRIHWHTSSAWHPLLGFSPQLGVNYVF